MHGNLKAIAGLFLIALAGTAWVSAQVAPVYQVIVGADPVALDIAVSDRGGKAVTDLRREDFAVYEDGQLQEVRQFEAVGMPYSILVLVDRSPRESKSKWPDFILKSVDLFLRNLRGPDRLAVAAFDSRVAVLVDWRPSRNGLVQKVMLRHSEQATKFFEAVDWAAEEMQSVSPGGARQQGVGQKGRKGVIVFTDGRDIDMTRENVRDLLRAHFKPEFLNRIDDIIMFKSLGKEEIAKIIDIQLGLLRKYLADRKITLDLSPAAREALFQEGYDPSFGARPLKRAIQKLISDELALKLLDGEIQPGGHVMADVNKQGEFIFEAVPVMES